MLGFAPLAAAPLADDGVSLPDVLAVLSAAEVGADTASGYVVVGVSAHLVAAEQDTDTAGAAARAAISAAVAATEVGQDEADVFAAVSVAAFLAAVEDGADTASGAASALQLVASIEGQWREQSINGIWRRVE